MISELVSLPPSIRVLDLYDSISDLLCSVLDGAELCRNVHYDNNWINAAEEFLGSLGPYLDSLNTHEGLYLALKRINDDPAVSAEMSEEQRRTSRIFQREMEMHGISLPESQKAEALALHSELQQLQSVFNRHIISHEKMIEIRSGSFAHTLPPSIRQRLHLLQRSPGVFLLPAETDAIDIILKWVEDEKIRKRVYCDGSNAAMGNLPILDRIIEIRSKLAEIYGFQSHSHMALGPNVAQSPERVELFLTELAEAFRNKAEGEIKRCQAIKAEDVGLSRHRKRDASADWPGEARYQPMKLTDQHGNPRSLPDSQLPAIHAWDTSYYMGIAKSRKFRLDATVLASYFSIANCFRGLRLLCERLFDIELRLEPLKPEESWVNPSSLKGGSVALSQDLVKVGVFDRSTNRRFATIFLDLWSRPNKFKGSACFVIQSAKRLPNGDRQLPQIALVCNFSRPMGHSPLKDSSLLLNHSEVEILLHEFGHAMHHSLSETMYQHVSGTRAELDFVEIPSNLFEQFIWDHRFVQEWAVHESTGAPIPKSMMENLNASRDYFIGFETLSQVVLGLFDQRVYGRQPMHDDTTNLFAKLQNTWNVIPHVAGTHWHTRNSHLCHYAANYYCYLWCKVFAREIWHRLFSADPLNRASGQKLREKFLKFGGSRPARAVLADLLDLPEDRVVEETIQNFVRHAQKQKE